MVVGYGSMELGTMAMGDAAILDRHPGAVGHAIDGVEIEIVDGEENAVAAGIEGAVRVRASYMVQGYMDNAESTAQFFRDGWFYPCDIGFKEADGLIVILGRDSDVLNVGGVKFTANAVEHEIRQIEGIGDVCALSVPNRFGVNVMVVLTIGDGAAVEQALEGEIGRVLGAMGLTNFITRWTDEIPRTGRGKIARDRLAQDMSRELWG
jgi:acyl-coenzyme A synthetase/AMP-(fatty) acid ligase